MQVRPGDNLVINADVTSSGGPAAVKIEASRY